MIYEHFRATGVCEAVQGLSDLFNIRLQSDHVQDFDTRRDQALLAASENTYGNGPGRVYMSQNCRILFSFRLYWLCMNKKTFATMRSEAISKTSY